MISRTLVALIGLVALASALDPQYFPSAAVSDLACKNGLNTHALWLPGVATNMAFLAEPQEPSLIYNAEAGTARLLGRVQDGNVIFDVDVTFSGFVGPDEPAPDGSPKLELKNSCYTGDVDPDTWSYFTGIDGFLTAVPGSFYEGGIIALGRHGPAMQIGIGANGKNTDFGFSAWLSRSVEEQPTNGNWISFSGSHGDFNINLEVVEEPECGCISVTETLFSGQTIDTGSVSWNYDGDFLFTAEATNGWIMQTIHIHVATEEPPTTGSGNPKIGQFEHHFNNVDTDFFAASIDGSDIACGSLVYIAFHAEMALIGEDGSIIQTETGFAEGPITFEGNRWGWYSTYQTCCDYTDCNFEGCQTNSDCDNGGNACARGVCSSGVCLLENNDSYSVPTTCGMGVCAAAGVQTCENQQLVDSCTPGSPSEEVCNGLDDNCDGNVDENYVSLDITCGSGGCEVSGSTVCEAGVVVEVCNYSETDGNNLANTVCGVGVCGATGVILCQAGEPQPDTCTAGEPESALDTLCDGRDNDCDGSVDEDYVPVDITCGSGDCEVSGSDICENGAVVGVCNYSETDGNKLADTTCGVGVCGATGVILCQAGEPQPDTCTAGEPESAFDTLCDGRDNDCDGSVDEDYVPVSTDCFPGDCGFSFTTSCSNGRVDECEDHTVLTDNQVCNTDLCLLNEFCTGGQCGGGVPKNCDDQNDCTVDTCDSSHGYCEHEALDSDECSGTIPVDVEVNCAANTTKICYEVFFNSNPALSHWSLCIPDNVQIDGSASSGPEECPVITNIGRDGSVDFDGRVVKFDCPREDDGDDEPWIFCVVFKGVYDISEDGLAIIKRGGLQEYTQTIGIADCGSDAEQSDVCSTSVTVEIDFTANKMARSACTTAQLRAQLAELAGVSSFATNVIENDGDHVTVTFLDSASASGAEAAATLIDALNGGARPGCLANVEAVAVVDLPYFSDDFSAFEPASNSGSTVVSSNSGSSSATESRAKSSSSKSSASALSASIALLVAALIALLV